MNISLSVLVRNFILRVAKTKTIDMETVKGSEEDLASLNKEELKLLFQKINARLSKGLLNGAHLKDQQENIRMLNKITQELNRRKAFPFAVRSSEETIPS